MAFKTITKEEFLQQFYSCIDKIIDTARYDNSRRYAYWVQFFDDNREKPAEVDICATSYCITLLSKCNSLTNSLPAGILQSAFNTIWKLRSEDGSWASTIRAKDLDRGSFEKSEYFSFNIYYYALSALLDVGFLSESFEYISSSKEVETLLRRKECVCKSVNWLINNAITSSRGKYLGWYYTNDICVNSSRKTVATIPTANLVSVLHRIRSCLKNNQQFAENSSMVDECVLKIDKCISDICEYFAKQSNGIGKVIPTNGESSQIIYICRMIDCFLADDNNHIDDIKKALQLIIKLFNQNEGNYISSYNEEYILKNSAGYDENVCHENYCDAIILHTLSSLVNKDILSKIDIRISSIDAIIRSTYERLSACFGRESNVGLFASMVNKNRFPVYASFEGHKAIEQCLNYKKWIENIFSTVTKKWDKNFPYLFISYSHKSISKRLKDDICYMEANKKLNINLWIDSDNIDGATSSKEDSWVAKVTPIIKAKNCKGVIFYISSNGMNANGLLREIEVVLKSKKQRYVFLCDFDPGINPKKMADHILSLQEEDPQMKIRKIKGLAEITQALKEDTDFSYYHVDEEFGHLACYDFTNWIEKKGVIREKGEKK